MSQYDHRVAVKETEHPIDIGAELDSALPDLLRPDQLLEVDRRDPLQVFQKAEHPRHLLGHLAR